MEYEKAKKYGNFNVDKNRFLLENHILGAGEESEQISFIGENSTEYIRKLGGQVMLGVKDAFLYNLLTTFNDVDLLIY